MTPKVRLRDSQLYELYHKTTHGVALKDACREAGVQYNAGQQAMRKVHKYVAYVMGGKKSQKRYVKTYLRVAKKIVEVDRMTYTAPAQSPQPPVQEAPAPPLPLKTPATAGATAGRYAKLNLAFELFADSLYRFIDEEVEARVGDIKAENERLTKLISGVQLDNWTDALKKRFNGHFQADQNQR